MISWHIVSVPRVSPPLLVDEHNHYASKQASTHRGNHSAPDRRSAGSKATYDSRDSGHTPPLLHNFPCPRLIPARPGFTGCARTDQVSTSPSQPALSKSSSGPALCPANGRPKHQTALTDEKKLARSFPLLRELFFLPTPNPSYHGYYGSSLARVSDSWLRELRLFLPAPKSKCLSVFIVLPFCDRPVSEVLCWIFWWWPVAWDPGSTGATLPLAGDDETTKSTTTTTTMTCERCLSKCALGCFC